MAQGDALAALHTENIVANYYVDPSGSDTTGDGSSGNPWATLQKAHDELKNTISWPGSGDVAVNIGEGTYQRTSVTTTLDIAFNNSSRAPATDRWLIWKPWAGAEGLVTIKPPTGATGAKNAIKTFDSGSSWFSQFMKFKGLIIDGGATRLGNNDTIGIYIDATADIEIAECVFKGIYAGDSGGASTKAQGIYAGGSSPRIYVYRNKFFDIGTATGTIDIQEHAVYLGSADCMVLGNLIYDIPNGFGIQMYNGGSAINGTIIAFNTISGSIDKSCIIVPGAGSNQKIVANILKNADEYGIEFYPATFTGSGNLVERNVSHGNGVGARSHASPAGWTIQNESTSDPLFVNIGSDDYHLQNTSPAIGHSISNYSLATDLDAVTRTAGAEDAGAYEYTAGGTSAVGTTRQLIWNVRATAGKSQQLLWNIETNTPVTISGAALDAIDRPLVIGNGRQYVSGRIQGVQGDPHEVRWVITPRNSIWPRSEFNPATAQVLNKLDSEKFWFYIYGFEPSPHEQMDLDLGWVADTGIWKVALEAAPYAVSRDGFRLKKATNLANCQATPDTWWWESGFLYANSSTGIQDLKYTTGDGAFVQGREYTLFIDWRSVANGNIWEPLLEHNFIWQTPVIDLRTQWDLSLTPDWISGSEVVKSMRHAVARRMEDVQAWLADLQNQSDVGRATWALSLWEELLGVPSSAVLSTSERQQFLSARRIDGDGSRTEFFEGLYRVIGEHSIEDRWHEQLLLITMLTDNDPILRKLGEEYIAQAKTAGIEVTLTFAGGFRADVSEAGDPV